MSRFLAVVVDEDDNRLHTVVEAADQRQAWLRLVHNQHSMAEHFSDDRWLQRARSIVLTAAAT